MAHINLLPWREQARKLKKMQFALLISASILAAVLCAIVFHFHYANLVTDQQQRNNYLQNILDEENSRLSQLNRKKKEQAKLLAELNFILNIKSSDFQIVRALDEIVRIVPSAVIFSQIARSGNSFNFVGAATSNLQITLLMEKMKQSKTFKQPVLTSITEGAGENKEEKTFELTVEQQG